MQHFDQPTSEWSNVDLSDISYVAEIRSTLPKIPARPAVEQLSRDAMVRRRAYMLWEGAGRPSGTQDAHWLQAAREIDLEFPSA